MRQSLVYLILLSIVTACSTGKTDMDLTHGWKIRTGDNMTWAAPGFEDADWDTISAGEPWENSVLPGYDGIAWYRKTITIPKRLKQGLEPGQHELILKLGRIDDASEVFWNGQMVLATGDFTENDGDSYALPREVSIPVEKVNWDGENVIAVRVFDFGGNGGLYSGPFVLLSSDWTDYIDIAGAFIGSHDHIHTAGDSVTFRLTLTNRSENAYRMRVNLRFQHDHHEAISSQWKAIRLAPGETETLDFGTRVLYPGFYEIAYSCSAKGRETNITGVEYYGCDPDKIDAGTSRPEDFSEYWTGAIAELRQVEPQYSLTPAPEYNTDYYEVFDVQMRSWGNVRVNGWYAKPRASGKHPALVMHTGYSWAMPPQVEREGFAVLAFNIRGHGKSVMDVDPGFPEYILTNITDEDRYIYKAAYMDAIRAVDFLCSRPEIDTSRIGVYGGSQGGALSFASAALDRRIKACAPRIPFLSDFRSYFKIAEFPRAQFDQFLQAHPGVTWTDVYHTLDYIDIRNLAPWINCPVLMAVGLRDQVCPPYTNFAAFNNITTKEKEFVIYPDQAHSIPQSHRDYELEWFRKTLGVAE